MKVGVIAVQGAVSEHLDILNAVFKKNNIRGIAIPIRKYKDLKNIDALIIPGGESTTISKHLTKQKIFDWVINNAHEGLPIMGTCAGCILLAKEGDIEIEKTKTQLLNLMDMKVERNAFGRQGESFEATLQIAGFKLPFKAVFIRAPAITKVWGNCKLMAKFEGKIVMARQENMVALAFHPELTYDTRIHEMFLTMI